MPFFFKTFFVRDLKSDFAFQQKKLENIWGLLRIRMKGSRVHFIRDSQIFFHSNTGTSLEIMTCLALTKKNAWFFSDLFC